LLAALFGSTVYRALSRGGTEWGWEDTAAGHLCATKESRDAAVTELGFVPLESGKKSGSEIWNLQSADLHVLMGTGGFLPERAQLEGFCIDFPGINLNECLKFLL
jgi:hypothetical protein